MKSLLRRVFQQNKKVDSGKEDEERKLLQSPLVSDKLQGLPKEYIQFMTWSCFQPVSGFLNYAKTRAFASLDMTGPSIDISCGDGSTSFIALGGELAVDGKTPVRFPQTTFTHGTDYNPRSLEVASSFRAHDALTLHDNDAADFPFDDGAFRTVYHNALYFVKDPVAFLRNVYASMHEDGIGLFQVWTDKFYAAYDEMGECFSSEMIHESSPFSITDTFHTRWDVKQWEDVFLQAGFKVQQIESAFPHADIFKQNVIERTLCLRNDYWRLLNEVSPRTQREIRTEWIEKQARFYYSCVTEEALKVPVEDAVYLSIYVTK
ncbi:methyltransferase domain-containing protein [Desulfovibrio sp. JC010]|uniref:methyltransferase domain-containing protein n=1 Tax=Desulfovibrio sp. JC010 TaxID=2593641 RepID=UPI0013CFD55A|nr:methyltransferase domain-containing protein [Desulfovibrio sp. JC010]NDV27486.1 class I SAM-dependent methyltransferase [Desulfovibrio sp. JC010]